MCISWKRMGRLIHLIGQHILLMMTWTSRRSLTTSPAMRKLRRMMIFSPQIHTTPLNMELVLPQGDSLEPRLARVTKRLKDVNGIPIGTADDNPLLNMRMYELEYLDGEHASLSANHIAENLFAQVDDEGNQQVLMKEIIDYCTNGQEVKQQDAFITTRTGTKRRRETTKGWEILIEWKDGSMNWVTLKDVKESPNWPSPTILWRNQHLPGGSHLS